MRTRPFLFIAALAASLLTPALFGAVGAEEKNKTDVKAKIAAGARILDVRTPAEFAEGHYANAVNLPVQQLKERLAEAGPKDKPVLVYCRSGHRSAMAKKILVENGWKDVTDAGAFRSMP